MRAELYEIPLPGVAGRLATMPRPRGGDWLAGELEAIRGAGFDTIVSLLTDDEADELGLGAEERESVAASLLLVRLPVADMSVPYPPDVFDAALKGLATELAEGRCLAVHCRAGIGRSSMIAASLMSCAGFTTAEAFAAISAARGLRVPETEAQRAWATAFAARASG
jgi:protein-tyrosine phosphatase